MHQTAQNLVVREQHERRRARRHQGRVHESVRLRRAEPVVQLDQPVCATLSPSTRTESDGVVRRHHREDRHGKSTWRFRRRLSATIRARFALRLRTPAATFDASPASTPASTSRTILLEPAAAIQRAVRSGERSRSDRRPPDLFVQDDWRATDEADGERRPPLPVLFAGVGSDQSARDARRRTAPSFHRPRCRCIAGQTGPYSRPAAGFDRAASSAPVSRRASPSRTVRSRPASSCAPATASTTTRASIETIAQSRFAAPAAEP